MKLYTGLNIQMSRTEQDVKAWIVGDVVELVLDGVTFNKLVVESTELSCDGKEVIVKFGNWCR